MGIGKNGSRLGTAPIKGIYDLMSETKRTFTQVTVSGTKPAPKPVASEAFVTPPQLKPETKGTPGQEEIGGYDGPEPTRFGDWEHKGRVTDF